MSIPKMPRNTCPAIDDVIKYASEAKDNMASIISEIEDLRSANSYLREGWEYWEAKADELENKVNDLDNIISDLRSQVVDLAEEAKMSDYEKCVRDV